MYNHFHSRILLFLSPKKQSHLMTAIADIGIVHHKIQSMLMDNIAFDSCNIVDIVISTL